MNHREFSGFAPTFLTTTLPYVNAPPHVGHALELVQGDALARFLRLSGEHVQTSSGTDDHSLKNVRAAESIGEPVRDFVARLGAAFVALADSLEARPDDLIFTSRDPRHEPSVARWFQVCRERGDLYRKRYRGAYCVGCEAFYQADELRDGVCPEHDVPPEPVEEENWFFRLSRYEKPLLEAIESGKLRILPEERRNEAIAQIRAGLEDISVSRSAERARGFGIRVPDDPAQVVYVWIDALANYLSVFDYGALGASCGWQRATRRIHVLGKGVLRFHAVYWPALLLSAGLELPTELRVHGYLTIEGRKIGKSLGNALDPSQLIEEYGATALRYYFLRHIPPFKDADFSRERLIEAHDSELADELGNLVRRVLTLVYKELGGRAPEVPAAGAGEKQLEAIVLGLPARLGNAFERHELAQGFDAVWELVRATNRYLDFEAPWRLAREAASNGESALRLKGVLGSAVGALRVIAVALWPFLPSFAERLALALSFRIEPGALNRLSSLGGGAGEVLAPPPLLAPRIKERVTRGGS